MKVSSLEISKVIAYLCRGVDFCSPKDVSKNALNLIVFLEIGQQVDIDGDLHLVINQGVRETQNTGNNILIEIYTGIVLGDDDADKVKITVFTKDKSIENMSSLEMLKFARNAQSGTVVIGDHAKCLV